MTARLKRTFFGTLLILVWACYLTPLIALFISLAGCATGPIIPACTQPQCVGPYDLGLTSHREGLLKP